MAATVGVDTNGPTHHSALSRHFFVAWQHRNESRISLWEDDPLIPEDPDGHPAARTQLTNLHLKLQHLKTEIVSLVAQDTALFEQLFALQEAILEWREQLDSLGPSSSGSSPCSTLSSCSSMTSSKEYRKQSSFVRHHVSYPPTARNRSHRIKSTVPQHTCQDSYDSGIHTSDHEIFV